MGIILMKAVFISEKESQTAKIAAELSELSQVGDVWALHGTLGMGKSVFARAFIKNLTSADEVPSPTFTLVQAYSAPDFEIYHYDLYRLEKPEDIFELGVEETFYEGVCLIEWPEKMGNLAPRNMWNVLIEPDEKGRKITVIAEDENKIRRLEKWQNEK